MAQLIVRGIESAVKQRLQRRARNHGRSMEEEVRDILRNSVNEVESPTKGLGTEIAALFEKAGLTEDIPEIRGHVVEPAEFSR
jgi:plasmid stability protein